MVNAPEILAIIPARGASKGVPRKNVLPLQGKPLIAYSVATALNAESITRTIVSTDDDEIAETAQRYGAEIPFMRPAEIAADATPDYPVFEHALKELERREGYRPDAVVQLRPTSPFRRVGLVDDAIRLFYEYDNVDCVRGVIESQQTPYKMWRIGDDHCMTPLLDTEFDEPYNMLRQHLPQTYWQTGHVDVIRTQTILEQNTLTGKRIVPLIIDPKYSLDIDTPLDFERSEWILERFDLKLDIPQLVEGEDAQRRADREDA